MIMTGGEGARGWRAGASPAPAATLLMLCYTLFVFCVYVITNSLYDAVTTVLCSYYTSDTVYRRCKMLYPCY